MVYAYDQWLPMPTKDLFDTQMMLASVNAAKDMYEKGLEEMKEFNEKYGDFLSPIAKDMQWNQEHVIDPVYNTINELYKAGIDPLRSAEGRSIIRQTINGIDKGRIARNKMSAANAIEYQKSIAKLGPLYNPDYEAFVLNGNTLDKFSSEDGVWMNTSASPYSTLQELVHPSFKEIKPHMLNKEEVESRGYVYNPLYDYEGITRADMERVMGSLMPGVRDDKRFQYHRELARRDLLAENGGKEPTDAEINKRLVDNAIEGDSQIMTPLTYDANKFALENIKYEHDLDVASAKANGNGTGSDYSGGFNFKDDIYEKGLKNMVGLDPTTFLGISRTTGQPVSMMKIADNNPEFFKTYKERIDKIVYQSNTSLQSRGINTMVPGGHPQTTHAVVEALTHSKGLPIGFLAKYNSRKTIDKYGDNNVEGLELMRLSSADKNRIYTEQELGSNFVATINGSRTSHNHVDLNKNGKFDSSAVATTDTDPNKGIVTGFLDKTLKSFVPIIIYRDNDMSQYETAYYLLDYNSVESSGGIPEWESKGISTIYDGKYDTSGQKSSGDIDKWLGVGSSELKSTSVTP